MVADGLVVEDDGMPRDADLLGHMVVTWLYSLSSCHRIASMNAVEIAA